MKLLRQKALWLLPILSFLISCQASIDEFNKQVGDHIYHEGVSTFYPDLPQGRAAELEPYIRSFEELLGRKIQIPITIGEVAGKIGEESTKGVCLRHLDIGYRGVIIDSDYFYKHNEKSPLRIEWLVFHELGHCVLGRGHLSEKVVREREAIKESMMDAYILSSHEVPIYERHKEYYLQELFDNRGDTGKE